MILGLYQEKKLKLYIGGGKGRGDNTLEILISTHPQTFATFKVHSFHYSGTVNVRGGSSVLNELTVYWERDEERGDHNALWEETCWRPQHGGEVSPARPLHRVQEDKGNQAASEQRPGQDCWEAGAHDAQVQGEDVREKRVCVSAASRPETAVHTRCFR